MRVLAIEDEDNWRKAFRNSFREPTYELKITDDIDEAEKFIKQKDNVDIAIVNINLIKEIPSDESGKGVLAYIKENYPNLPRIVVSGTGGSAKEIMEKFDVYDVLFKPFRIENLIATMNSAIDEQKNRTEKQTQNRKFDVFISYATEDYNVAKRLYDDLKHEGITPWDREDLLPGKNWRIEIPHIIRSSSYFLLIISANSVSKKGYVQKEQKIALELLDEFPSNEIFIIPARIDNTEPIDEKLKNLNWADLSDYRKGLEQILKVLKSGNTNHMQEKQGVKESKTDKGDRTMILESLTTATIGAGVKFLFDQAAKLVGRLNDEQLAKKKEIEEKAKAVKTEQDVIAVQNSMTEFKKILPADAELDSIDAFVAWVEERVDTNFDELIGVGELICKVLREKRKVERNPLKKEKLEKMESGLKIEIEQYNTDFETGDAKPEGKRRIFERINKAVELIKNLSSK